MKRNVKLTVALTLALLMLLTLISCNTVDKEGLWENATHRKDMSFGEGSKTVTVTVEVEDQTVTFTIHTDKETVGDALLEHGLIAGEEGPFGLYIKQVNGITADYDVDQSYWAFNVNGEASMTGVDMTALEDGASYALVYTK